MEIRLEDTRVLNLSFCSIEESEFDVSFLNSEDFDGISNFSISTCFPESEPGKYYIIFKLELLADRDKVLNVEYGARFETLNEDVEAFKESSFVYVNSPAIAYPYLRAYISTLLILSGYDSVTLPTINFQRLYNDHKDNIVRKCN